MSNIIDTKWDEQSGNILADIEKVRRIFLSEGIWFDDRRYAIQAEMSRLQYIITDEAKSHDERFDARQKYLALAWCL